jgi:hypothetical protein
MKWGKIEVCRETSVIAVFSTTCANFQNQSKLKLTNFEARMLGAMENFDLYHLGLNYQCVTDGQLTERFSVLNACTCTCSRQCFTIWPYLTRHWHPVHLADKVTISRRYSSRNFQQYFIRSGTFQWEWNVGIWNSRIIKFCVWFVSLQVRWFWKIHTGSPFCG